jgi:hypothetical protein
VSKISELSDGGSLVSSDYLIAVRSGGNVKVRMDQINVDQVDLGDNEFIRLGNSQDLTMVHTSTQSIINQAGIGDLLIQKAGTTKASITANGLEFPDNSKAIFGASSDLQIYHDGSNSHITDAGTGNLILQATDFVLKSGGTGAYIEAASGVTKLYHSNALKLATTATGIDVTGTVTADGLTVSNGTNTTAIPATSDRLSFTAGSSFIQSTGAFFVQPAGDLVLNGTGAEIMRLKSGNVGIGTSSPDAIIETSASATGNTVGALLTNTNGSGTADSVSLNFGLGRSVDGYIRSVEAIKLLKEQQWTGTASTVDAALVFSTVSNEATSEAMRIDASGNLLVGKSSFDSTTVGAILRPTGAAVLVADGGDALLLNRKTSDGSIVDFRKNNTTVGSIGVNAGSIAFGQSNTGLGAFNTDRLLFPATSSGAVQDNAIDLGYANGRFKDLFLSGGVYLGGTGAANKLDDYEEGTWTPSTTVGLTSTYARYTKVGNRVFFDLEVTITTNSNAGQMQINALPFAASGEGSATLGYTTATASNPILMVQGTGVYFYSGGSSIVAYSTYSNKIIRLTGTYMTTA